MHSGCFLIDSINQLKKCNTFLVDVMFGYLLEAGNVCSEDLKCFQFVEFRFKEIFSQQLFIHSVLGKEITPILNTMRKDHIFGCE